MRHVIAKCTCTAVYVKGLTHEPLAFTVSKFNVGDFHAASNKMCMGMEMAPLHTRAGGYMSGYTISDLVIY